MTEKQKRTLKAAFTTAIAAFELADSLSKIYGGEGLDELSQRALAIQKAALLEAQKESPSFDAIHDLLMQMHPPVVGDAVEPLKFPPGGIVSAADGGEYIVGEN